MNGPMGFRAEGPGAAAAPKAPGMPFEYTKEGWEWAESESGLLLPTSSPDPESEDGEESEGGEEKRVRGFAPPESGSA